MRGAASSSTSADGGAGAIAFTYNGPGEVTATDALGDATQSFYDAAGFLVKSVDGLGNPIYDTYDVARKLAIANRRRRQYEHLHLRRGRQSYQRHRSAPRTHAIHLRAD